VNVTVDYGRVQAAGTGIVLGSAGTVLTNNHVIDGATTISATDVANGRTYSATVVGYDVTDDIAVLHLKGASGLTALRIGKSAALRVGDRVVALGNAGGVGGTPTVASGRVTALNQTINAVDESGGAPEALTGLIETNAPIQAGDSGGPLVNSSGQVIGMTTAGSSAYLASAVDSQAYAIPGNRARTIAAEILGGQASDTVHIGATAFLGVQAGSFPFRFSGAPGVSVAGVVMGTPAERVGLVPGDTIVSINGHGVGSPSELTSLLDTLHPGQSVQLGWQDVFGQSHTARVTLATGPAD